MPGTAVLPASAAAAAAAWRGRRPRLFLNAARLAELRGHIGGSHARLWQKALALAERLAASEPPAYDAAGGDALDNEQLWQREVGYALPHLALARLLTGERRFLEALRRWALAGCAYPTWGLGWVDGKDLAASHQLFGLAVAYDWCGAELDAEARGAIAGTLARRGARMFAAAARPSGPVWWSRTPLNNHQWVNCGGLAAAGLALWDEHPAAADWVAFAGGRIREAMALFAPDGASHEGLIYWAYGAQALLQYMHLARELLGEDLHDHPWWRSTAAYRLYLTLPEAAWSRGNFGLVNLADCRRSGDCGPEHVLRRLAAEFRDGHAQRLAARLEAAGITTPQSYWLNLVWFDPAVPERPPEELPTLRHFENLGLVSARSDWSGRESLVVFKCGPSAGHRAAASGDPALGSGHPHPDANHFLVFGAGQWLLRDDGYCTKHTDQHNALLVAGRGQLGEGKAWFDRSALAAAASQPRVLRAAPAPALDHLVGEAAGAYHPELGLRRFARHLLFLKPDVLVVADEVELAAPAELELLFHPEDPAERGADGAWTAAGDKAVLRLEPLTPEGVSVAASEQTVSKEGGREPATMFRLGLRTRRAAWRNAVALSWAPAGERPPRAALRADGAVWTFAVGDRRARLDWDSGLAGAG